MTNPGDSNPDKATQSPPPETAPAPHPAAVDLESGVASGAANGGVGGGGVADIVRRWNREGLLRKAALASRGFGLVFSLLAFVLMASNKHGDWKDFDKYEEYRYVTAIAILSTLYTALQAFRHYRELSSGAIFTSTNLAMVDFLGDQIVAYLLLSAASSAVPMTNRMREGADNIFTDQSASAISMEFFAFLSMALSALISGYKLSKQAYI